MHEGVERINSLDHTLIYNLRVGVPLLPQNLNLQTNPVYNENKSYWQVYFPPYPYQSKQLPNSATEWRSFGAIWNLVLK